MRLIDYCHWPFESWQREISVYVHLSPITCYHQTSLNSPFIPGSSTNYIFLQFINLHHNRIQICTRLVIALCKAHKIWANIQRATIIFLVIIRFIPSAFPHPIPTLWVGFFRSRCARSTIKSTKPLNKPSSTSQPSNDVFVMFLHGDSTSSDDFPGFVIVMTI